MEKTSHAWHASFGMLKSTWISWFVVALVFVGIIILLVVQPPVALAQPDVPNENTWTTDGTVYATATDGTNTYIGGSFTNVGPNTGRGAAISKETGSAIPPYSKADNNVFAVAPDGSGGWYIGGTFTSVGGVARNRLAHILSDGTLDATWEPDANATVWALAVDGGILYVGGDFTQVGDPLGPSVRTRLAAFDIATGNLTSWNPNANSTVRVLTVSDGIVYAGGLFTRFGGQGRSYVAAIETGGTVTSWNPTANSFVFGLAVSGGVVCVGGYFTTMSGQSRNRLAAIGTDGTLTSWNPNANNGVWARAVGGETWYAGG